MRPVLVGLAILAAAAVPARAERTLLADDYLDRLRGMWLGEILGNYAGRPVEGQRLRGGLTYAIDWADLAATDPWQGDDDTVFESMYASMLAGAPAPSPADVQDAWEAHVVPANCYIANRQARWLMDYGIGVPDTGSIHYNMHWYAIDSQITTEAVGAAAPGMRQQAADLAADFGGVTNDGYALHAAQFYAAMYAAAPFETDVADVVAKGLEVVPASSRTSTIIEDVCAWHADDLADGTPDWRSTQEKIWDAYGLGDTEPGRYHDWIESAVNTALTTMAILYGEGDFKQTVEIAVQGGYDADCNPATAGGLVGLMSGYSGLPADLTAAATDTYEVAGLTGVPTPTTISAVAATWQAAAEQQILAAPGGSIDGTGPGRTYHLPDDVLAPTLEKWDPDGPAGLVHVIGTVGGTVAASASVEAPVQERDRDNLDQIIDGIVDVTYNGHVPYATDDGDNAQPAGGDWYQVAFDRDVAMTSVVFTEGDIVWDRINSDPRVTAVRGGYFEDLTVEVRQGGTFVPVSNIVFSEPLDPYTYYQSIELSFDWTTGDAVRIRGTAGGAAEFTTILELEVRGALDLGDGNLVVDYATPPAGDYSPEFLAVEALVASGFQDGPGGYWDGPGIQSSAAAAMADHATALAVFDNAGPGGGKADLEGEPVDATAVLVKYTWYGDINLDGVVDFNDYNIIDNTFLGGATTDQHWQRGDLNYDGVADFNDYNLIDNTYLAHAGETLGASGGGLPVPTPEPATLALVAVGAAAVASRRRTIRR